VAAAPSSSSRVDIAPQRRRDPPPANREPCDACRPPPSTLIGTDLLDITGGEPTEPATTPDGPRDTATVRSDAAERQKVIKGRVRVTERSSRRLVASFCFRRVRRAYVRLDYDNTTTVSAARTAIAPLSA